MKKIIKYLNLSIITSLLLFSCEVSDFDLQESPNFTTPQTADPDLLINELQYLFQDIMADMITNTDDIMRYEAMTNSYSDVVSANVLNVEWERFYEALLISRTIEAQASLDEALAFHNAVGKLLAGYLTVTMVDYVGNIPYSQAGNNNEFPNPVIDSGIELYQTVLSDIDQAKTAIENTNLDLGIDVFYDNDKSKWVAFANSFKLRLLIQARMGSSDLAITDLESQINTLISSDIIDSAAEDFVFPYTAVEEPESRHPYYIRAYLTDFDQYIGNYFMWMLKDSKSISDPRIRYYLYRQSDADPFSGPPYLACGGDPDVDFCYVGDQYWGLDHGETRTGRGDNLLRTTYGIYPAGGAFDEDQFQGAPSSSNLGGSGFLPILTSYNLKFLTAESALMLGTSGDPATLLEEAVRASMSKVLNFGDVASTFAATNDDVDDYVSEVIANYNAAASNEEKLDVIITEYYLANFGNSIDAYNAYRRTGYPSNIQIPIDDDTPTFPRSFRYSEDAVNLNSSISQKPITDKVFWDKNPDGFIN